MTEKETEFMQGKLKAYEELLKEHKMKIIENLINKYFTKTLMNNLAYEIRAGRLYKTLIRYNGKYATLNVCNFRKYNSKFTEVFRCSFNEGLRYYCHDYFEILKKIEKNIEVLENENKL